MLTQPAQKLLMAIDALRDTPEAPAAAALRLSFYDFLFSIGETMGESAITDIMPQPGLSSKGALEESLRMLETAMACLGPDTHSLDEDTKENARIFAENSLGRISGHVNAMMLSLSDDVRYEVFMLQIRRESEKCAETDLYDAARQAIRYNTLSMSDVALPPDEPALCFYLARLYAERFALLACGDGLKDVFKKLADAEKGDDWKICSPVEPKMFLQNISLRSGNRGCMTAAAEELCAAIDANARLSNCFNTVKLLGEEYEHWQIAASAAATAQPLKR